MQELLVGEKGCPDLGKLLKLLHQEASIENRKKFHILGPNKQWKEILKAVGAYSSPHIIIRIQNPLFLVYLISFCSTKANSLGKTVG